MTSTSKINVAVVQAEVASDLAASLQRTTQLARAAKRDGAEVVVFPETWLPGYPIWLDVCRDVALWNHEPVKRVFARYAKDCVDVHGASGNALRELAASLGITLVTGISERVESGRGRGTLYNSVLTIGPDGSLLNHHRKLVPTYTERMVWGNGDADGLHAVATPHGRVGSLVCWEHWMPLARQAMHESGEDLHVAVWPTVHEMHQVASRQYAFEGRCFVLAAGSIMHASALPPELEPHPDRVSSPASFIMRGGSAIIGPDGRYIEGPVFEKEITLHASLDLSEIREESMSLDVTGHYSRPDCFDFHVKRAPR